MENDFQMQKSLLSRNKEKDSCNIERSHRKTPKTSGRRSKMLPRATVQDQTDLGKFSQQVKILPHLGDHGVLQQDIGKVVAQLCQDKRGLHEYIWKCNTGLESAAHDRSVKAHEIEQLKEIILALQEANSKLEQRSEKIQHELCKDREAQHGSYVDGLQTPFLLESAAKDMFSFISTCCSLLSKYQDRNGYRTAYHPVAGSDLFSRVRIAREYHWTFLLKHLICSRLFENFETETFTRSGSRVLFLNHEERGSKCLEYFTVCKSKWRLDRAFYDVSSDTFDYLFFQYFASIIEILPWDITFTLRDLFKIYDEQIASRLLEHLSHLAPAQKTLVEGLIVVAGKLWQFHKLCLSFEPPATIFRVSEGDLFNQDYVENNDALEKDNSNSVPKVGFMIFPGFRLRKSIIKCEVYLAM
ncbi:unnamed protein product [Calypogeia fissa]